MELCSSGYAIVAESNVIASPSSIPKSPRFKLLVPETLIQIFSNKYSASSTSDSVERIP